MGLRSIIWNTASLDREDGTDRAVLWVQSPTTRFWPTSKPAFQYDKPRCCWELTDSQWTEFKDEVNKTVDTFHDERIPWGMFLLIILLTPLWVTMPEFPLAGPFLILSCLVLLWMVRENSGKDVAIEQTCERFTSLWEVLAITKRVSVTYCRSNKSVCKSVGDESFRSIRFAVNDEPPSARPVVVGGTVVETGDADGAQGAECWSAPAPLNTSVDPDLESGSVGVLVPAQPGSAAGQYGSAPGLESAEFQQPAGSYQGEASVAAFSGPMQYGSAPGTYGSVR